MAEILMVTAIAGAENCAAVLFRQFQMQVQTVPTRREAIAALRRGEYRVAIFDESLVEPAGDACDFAANGDDPLYRHLGGAIPVEVNFAISGCGRLLRTVRAALGRAGREREAAATATAASVDREWRESAAGLLLQAQLAQAEPGVSPALAERLKTIAGLAEKLCSRIRSTQAVTAQSARPAPAQLALAQPEQTRTSSAQPVSAAKTPGIGMSAVGMPVVGIKDRSASASRGIRSTGSLRGGQDALIPEHVALSLRNPRRHPATA
jgi:hypothetical protein